MSLQVFIDVDRTLVDDLGELKEGVREALRGFEARGYVVTLWSSAGARYARDTAKRHGLENFFQGYAPKPDIFIDDDPASLEKAPCVPFYSNADWVQVSHEVEKHSARIEEVLRWHANVPDFIDELADRCDSIQRRLTTLIWTNRNSFVKWPEKAELLWEGCVRKNEHSNPNCYNYPPDLKKAIEDSNVDADTRSNGPAIVFFQIAGGQRPRREDIPRWGWTIHHIYDGRFPAPGKSRTLHAVRHKRHFTQAAGLVALHPVADGLASHCAFFAWLLRFEAFKRFSYDPDKVFGLDLDSSVKTGL